MLSLQAKPNFSLLSRVRRELCVFRTAIIASCPPKHVIQLTKYTRETARMVRRSGHQRHPISVRVPRKYRYTLRPKTGNTGE